MGERWRKIGFWFLGEALILALAYLWYDSLWWILFLQVLQIPYTLFLRKSYTRRKMIQYENGFYDFLQSLLPSLQAGYSLENACTAAYLELKDMNGPHHAFVIQMEKVVRGINVHIPVEELFHEMASDTGNSDIHQFAVILEILKNMGGNSVEVLRSSMVRIQKKMETSQEIRTIMSGKIYEKNLMMLMPFFMIFYLRVSNGNYLDPLYHTLAGQCVMTAALGGIIACFYWSEKIMNISF